MVKTILFFECKKCRLSVKMGWFRYMSSFRGFIAIDIEDVPKLFLELQRQIVETGADVKLVKPRSIHITLKFLGNVEEKLLTEESEVQLNTEFIKLSTIINNYLLLKDYDKALNEFILFGTSIDKFFDDVMVNVDDEKIRNNRYCLLGNIRTLFLNVADLNRIVVEG